jgi:hypothetical protein
MISQKTTFLVSLAVVGLLAAGSSAAAQRLSGAGAESCSVFLQRITANTSGNRPALQWVMGYLTGRTEALPDGAVHKPFRGPDGIATDVKAYCRSHPGAQIGDAAASFFEPVGILKSR